MATIYVDNKPYEVKPGQSLLSACLGLGLNLPYFCWHPALGSVGACRQCAIKQFKDENDTRGRLVMACMTPVAEKVRISIEDKEAVDFRAGVIEGLMQSHPHDCPVCDEGGECHLQDMTVMTGHIYRQYEYTKRTFHNQYLGPFVNHEMNRCIQCYRCVRYYREYAGESDLNSFLMRNQVFFGRSQDGVLQSEFAGNLVEICPTGVFTDKTLKQHYTRKWDLQMAPSICVHCGLGCNTTAGERYGTVRRIVNRYNGDVNGYFLCDRGRFGYEFVNRKERIRQPLQRKNGSLEAISAEQAQEHLKSLVATGNKVIGIGSPRASLEANFALRTAVGAVRFFSGVSEADARLASLILDVLRKGPARTPSLTDMEMADAVLVLGEDVMNVAPRAALALRQSTRQAPMEIARKKGIADWQDDAVREAVQEEKGPLYIATPNATRLDGIAKETFRAAPDDIARLGFAVANAIDPAAPAPPGLPSAVADLAARIAQTLKGAQRPLVVCGAGCRSEAVIQAAANVAAALAKSNQGVALSFAAPECNTMGLAMMGGAPLEAAFQAVRDGNADTVIVLENDLYRRADSKPVDEFLKGAKHVVALDYLPNSTTGQAELILPAGSFAEADGTFVNSEGRAQRFFQVFLPQDPILESWRWLRAAGQGDSAAWKNLDNVLDAMAQSLPAFKRVPEAAPESGFRISGAKVPREPHRYSGRTAMLANISVSEPKPPEDQDSPLSFTMEGNPNEPPSALIPFFWAPGWNSIQSTNKFQSEIAGPLKGGNPGVRLIEPAAGSAPSYFTAAPEGFHAKHGEWLTVPLYHIFGSEELSNWAPAVRELAPGPYAALSPEEAAALGVIEGQIIQIAANGSQFQLPLKVAKELPKGVVGLPVGLPDFRGPLMPAWVSISRAI
ncbi:MAG TPA: NADH-quinone oxidoreductase subunit NuoG [Terriglobia bacterium]|nr:NADH-quinone oxidoreductase subunit NuoG [Terriglobia bacterium]